jgi:hypothetical protein
MRFRRSRGPGSRFGGTIIIIVLGILLILGLLGFSLLRSVSETSNVVYAHTFSLLLDQAGMELVRIITADLGRELRMPDSPLRRRLLETAPTAFPIVVSGRSSRWLQACSFYGQPLFENFTATIEVAFEAADPLSPDLPDPWEKKFQLEIDLRLAMGKTAWRRISKRFRVTHLGKVQRLIPPVLGKFTLLVREPEPSDHANIGYNCVENRIDGSLLSSSRVRPLVLFHRTTLQQKDLKRVGWVGLGGAKDIQLHVAAGGDPRFGEIFQFFPLANPGTRPPLFVIQNVPGTSAFQSRLTLVSSPILRARLSLQGALFGFYTLDSSDPPQDMNYDNTLERFFAAADARVMSSSMLHLCGNLANPSPTRVFGRVKRVFAQYSALVADLEPCDGRNDSVLCMLRNPARFTGGGISIPFWDSLAPVSIMKVKGQAQPQEIEPFSMQQVFGTEAAYRAVCSRLVMEDYNRVNDYLSDTTNQIPPPQTYRTVFGDSRHALTNVKISTADGRILGPIDLENLSSAKLLQNRVSLVLNTPADLEGEYLSPAGLNPAGQVLYVKTGPLVLPRNTEVKSSGVLAVQGDIIVEGGLSCAPGVQVALVSRGGNIRIRQTNETIHAFLAALDGTVIPEGATPVRIVGGMAVKRLVPGDWPAGGEITWDDRFDCLQDDDTPSYAVQLSDYAERWEVGAL